ncbi:MAG: RNA polymerase sigma factor [Terriglobales bacterium]
MIEGGHEAHREVERAARSSYGRLLAYLSARTCDLATAEDALGDALLAALRTWPRDGVPARPEAWLLTAARNVLADARRHRGVMAAAESALRLLHRRAQLAPEVIEFPDERLKLLFVCAHPALDPALRAPLMLQTVLGLDAAAIAPAFLATPAAMSQRLVRAKARIRDQNLRFDVPAPRDLPERLPAVLEAVYAAFGLGWEALPGTGGAPSSAPPLAEEALWIARDLQRLLPGEPEVLGLLAVLLHCRARRTARRAPSGAYLPLTQQDTRLWDRTLIAEAERLLLRAAPCHRPGRFQLEAAIQSVHADRARTGRTEWAAIAAFYEQLVRLAPSLGACTAHAAATAEAGGPAAGLARLDTIDPHAAASYQPFWAVRGHLLAQLGYPRQARAAYGLAIALSHDPAVRDHLRSKSRALARRTK